MNRKQVVVQIPSNSITKFKKIEAVILFYLSRRIGIPIPHWSIRSLHFKKVQKLDQFCLCNCLFHLFNR